MCITKLRVLHSTFDSYWVALRLCKTRLLCDCGRNKIWDHSDKNINKNMFECIIQKIIQQHQHRQHQDKRKVDLTQIRPFHLSQNDKT